MDHARTGKQDDLFYQLTPDFVLNSVEAAGWRTTGEYLQLNSYENRVYSLRLEEPAGEQVIAKFYRPGRWSEASIREEHAFLAELEANGVAVVAPVKQANGDTLSLHQGLWCTIFPKARGRMPQEFTSDDLTRLGRVLARLHNVGALSPAKARPTLDAANMGWPALDTLAPLISPSVRDRYLDAAQTILEYLEDEVDPRDYQRIHGDCHRGNVLQTDEAGQPRQFFLLDFDDFGNGLVTQDLWMLFRHDDDDIQDELDAFLTGYTELRDFDENELRLMTPLRGLRILHYAAWIARRWSDPSFPQIFPQFGSEGYWFDEQRALEAVVLRLGE
jgi:Ser/Thr protein kinase RdoA (MazF antagonist)